MKRKYKKKLPPLYKMIEHHLPMCSFWIYSGDRHCSCGKEAAEKALALVRERLGEPLATELLGKIG